MVGALERVNRERQRSGPQAPSETRPRPLAELEGWMARRLGNAICDRQEKAPQKRGEGIAMRVNSYRRGTLGAVPRPKKKPRPGPGRRERVESFNRSLTMFAATWRGARGGTPRARCRARGKVTRYVVVGLSQPSVRSLAPERDQAAQRQAGGGIMHRIGLAFALIVILPLLVACQSPMRPMP